ncbi:hypothetical protein ABVT39_025329 [Epinephelus coioides]
MCGRISLISRSGFKTKPSLVEPGLRASSSCRCVIPRSCSLVLRAQSGSGSSGGGSLFTFFWFAVSRVQCSFFGFFPLFRYRCRDNQVTLNILDDNDVKDNMDDVVHSFNIFFMTKTGKPDSYWKDICIKYAQGKFHFSAGKRPGAKKWKKALEKIDACPLQSHTKDLFRRNLRCSCGFHKLALDRKCMTFLKPRTNGNSSSYLQSVIEEAHSEEWARQTIRYLSDCERHMRMATFILSAAGHIPPPPFRPLPLAQWFETVHSNDILSHLDEMKG